jgi:hypothetical protein
MGALTSLVVTLISLTLSLAMSLFVTIFNLMVSLLGIGIRASAPRHGRKGSGGALGGFVLVTIAVLVALAPRTTISLGIFALMVFMAHRYVRNAKSSRPPNARKLAQRLEEVRMMTGTQFELFVADPFRAMGQNARHGYVVQTRKR